MRLVETLTLLLAAAVLFMWAVFAHPTQDERARLYDSMGSSTGIAWR
jgi:ABC-type cobalamin transport system permease subunit